MVLQFPVRVHVLQYIATALLCPAAMTMTDRTEEFRGAVNVFRPTVTVVNNSSEAAAGRAQSDLGYRKTSEFLQLASSVAVGFEGTSKLVRGVTDGVVLVRVWIGWMFLWRGWCAGGRWCLVSIRPSMNQMKSLDFVIFVCVPT